MTLRSEDEVRALKPCPFCGSTNLAGENYQILCEDCGSGTCTGEDARATWNRRATSPLDAARLAVVKAAKAINVEIKLYGEAQTYEERKLREALAALKQIEKEG